MSAPEVPSLPFVSIILPAKNEERDIGMCMKSLQSLDYPSDRLEIILVDNGSTDATREIASAAGALVLREDQGTIARLRNIGVSRSRGAILAFLDADMEVSENWLNHAVEVLEDDGVGAVGGLLKIPSPPTWVEETWSLKRTARPYRGEVSWLGSGNLLMRQSVFDEIGGWNEELATCEDLDLCARIRKKYRLVHFEPVAAIHHGGAKTLGEVFRKEIWRGSNNLDNFWNRIQRPEEIPTLVFPILHGVFLLMVPVMIISNPFYTPIPVGLSLLFPLLRAGFVAIKAGRWDQLPQLTLLWGTYYSARAIAPFFRN